MNSSAGRGATGETQIAAKFATGASRKKASESLTLLAALQRSYKDRWAILLDSIFSNAYAERVILVSPFVPSKENGQLLLTFRGLTLREGSMADTAISSRHINSGLLTKYWTSLAAVLPVLVCSPSQGDTVLILGRPSYGRLLAILQLLFGRQPEEQLGHRRSSSELQRSSSKKRRELRKTSAPLPGSQRSEMSVEKAQSWDGSKPAERDYMQLPWRVYGEGGPPLSWQSSQAGQPHGSLAEHIQSGLVPLKPTQGWSFGNLLTGVLQQGIKAGCCMVRTSSGDVAEACALEAHRPQDSSERLEAQPDSAKARYRDCFHPSACLGDTREYDRFEEVSEAAPSPLPVHLHCCTPDAASAQGISQLLEHHVPPEAIRGTSVRGPTHSDSTRWWKSATDDTFDCIIIERPAAANKDAILAACQSGDKSGWPDSEARRSIRTTISMLTDSFHALRSGGHLMYCSESLAHEETDGLIRRCLRDLQGHGQVVHKPLSTHAKEAESVSIAMKKWGAERTEYGWRLLPDLSFQDPQYFCIIHRV